MSKRKVVSLCKIKYENIYKDVEARYLGENKKPKNNVNYCDCSYVLKILRGE